MIKKYLPAILLSVAVHSLFAQRAIQVSYLEDAQGNTIFSCTNRAYCNYVLDVDFTSLENAVSDHPLPFRTIVQPGVHRLFKLSVQHPGTAIQFKYRTGYFKGCLDPKIDTGFVYLLPIGPGRQTQAYELGNLPKQSAGEPDAKNPYGVRLRMKPGDTIYAARRGVVTEVEVGSHLNDSGMAESGAGNYIEIVHEDCSFGQYGVIKANGSLVRPGQRVETGDPIGLVGGDKFGRGSEIRLNVYFNGENEQHNSTTAGATIYHFFVPLKFWTKKNGKGMLKHGGTYISEWPKALLLQEKAIPAPHGARKPRSH